MEPDVVMHIYNTNYLEAEGLQFKASMEKVNGDHLKNKTENKKAEDIAPW
jgi:hypothetical protein